jgi:hypothetical protein
MDNVPDDILLLVFGIYIHDDRLPATSLLSVCRRWHDLLISNPSFWSRVTVIISSTETIPTILGDGPYGLKAYVARSNKEGTNIFLDLDIKLKGLKYFIEEHIKTCSYSYTEKGGCLGEKSFGEECDLSKQYKRQLQDLFKVFVGIPENDCISRWATLKLDMTYVQEANSNKEGIDQISLSDDTKRIIIPNLISIELNGASVKFSSVEVPRLQRLIQNGYISTTTITSVENVEVVGITVKNLDFFFSFSPIPRVTWPRLHTLRISNTTFLWLFPNETAPKLKTLILDFTHRKWNEYGADQYQLSVPNATKSLETIILLGTSESMLYKILDRNPQLFVPTWKLGSACYLPDPHDDQMSPCYRARPRGACGGGMQEANTFWSIFMTLTARKMKIESMDPCITDAFARFHADTTNKFRDRVVEPALTEVELGRIKEYQKTLKPVGERERFA